MCKEGREQVLVLSVDLRNCPLGINFFFFFHTVELYWTMCVCVCVCVCQIVHMWNDLSSGKIKRKRVCESGVNSVLPVWSVKPQV